MPTQKVFKQRVRTRMTKTGESYPAARRQLLEKAAGTTEAEIAGPAPEPESIPAETLVVADEAMLRATGKRHAEWFAVLDSWGGTEHTHTEIARYLHGTLGVPGWWTQSVTVSYERARGMRARHQMADGFSITASRTIEVAQERACEAVTDPGLRGRWVSSAGLQQRPTRAAWSAQFDWSDPPSRVIIGVAAKGAGKSLVYVTHEQLPDAESGERLKGAWRATLVELKELLERAPGL